MSWEKTLKRKELEAKIEALKKKFRFGVPNEKELAEYQQLTEAWKKVLKRQTLTQTSATVPVVEEEEEEDGPCKRRLKEMAKFWLKYKKDLKHDTKIQVEVEVKEFLENVDEKTCCKFLQEITSDKKMGTSTNFYQGTEMRIGQGEKGVYLYMGQEEPTRVYFEIDIELTPASLYWSDDVYDYMVRQAEGKV